MKHVGGFFNKIKNKHDEKKKEVKAASKQTSVSKNDASASSHEESTVTGISIISFRTKQNKTKQNKT